jgi:hypothetical protein
MHAVLAFDACWSPWQAAGTQVQQTSTNGSPWRAVFVSDFSDYFCAAHRVTQCAAHRVAQ